MLAFSNFVETVWGKPFSIPAWLYPSAHCKVHGWVILLRKNLIGPHRALTSIPPLGWTGMNIVSPGFLSNTWPHKCSTGWMGKNSHKNTPKSCGMSFQKTGSYYSSILMSVFRKGCHYSPSWCNGQVYHYFCPYSVWLIGEMGLSTSV